MSAASTSRDNKRRSSKVEIRRMGSNMKNSMAGKEKKDRTLAKALDSKRELAPKTKHVRNFVLRSWRENSIRCFFNDVARLPIDRDPVMAFKALEVLHKLLHDGPPSALQDAHAQIGFLKAIESNWNRRNSIFFIIARII